MNKKANQLIDNIRKLLTDFPARKMALWQMWVLDLPALILSNNTHLWIKNGTIWQLQGIAHYLLFGYEEPPTKNYYHNVVDWEDVVCNNNSDISLAGEIWRLSLSQWAACAHDSYTAPDKRRDFLLADLAVVAETPIHLPKL